MGDSGVALFFMTLLVSTLRKATPLILASLGGFFSEKSGVVNIALEGIMLFGAFVGAVVAQTTQNPWLGVLAAAGVGGAVAAIHATASIWFRANQIVSGLGVNLLAVGATIFLCEVYTGGQRSFMLSVSEKLPRWGPFLPLVYIALLMVPVVYLMVYRTRQGLRLRAVGEHPEAARTMGVDVQMTRFWAVVISGVLAGVAGSFLPFFAGSFAKNMTNGLGYIALGALIFGRWTPWGALAASLLFGSADALQEMLQGRGGVPSQFFQMVPYVLTMVALAGIVGRAIPPRALGIPLRKE
ncbi:MAG: ABC transporter permease [Candidatus Eisenbacteria sp.]|nr:ABC transporter permease [Candidatus Eisenbacteria bacterium]